MTKRKKKLEVPAKDIPVGGFFVKRNGAQVFMRIEMKYALRHAGLIPKDGGLGEETVYAVSLDRGSVDTRRADQMVWPVAVVSSSTGPYESVEEAMEEADGIWPNERLRFGESPHVHARAIRDVVSTVRASRGKVDSEDLRTLKYGHPHSCEAPNNPLGRHTSAEGGCEHCGEFFEDVDDPHNHWS